MALPRLVSSRQREVVRCRLGMTASLLRPSVLRNANESGQPDIYVYIYKYKLVSWANAGIARRITECRVSAAPCLSRSDICIIRSCDGLRGAYLGKLRDLVIFQVIGHFPLRIPFPPTAAS